VLDVAKELLVKYSNGNGQYLLPLLKSDCNAVEMKRHIRQGIKTVNKYIDRIAAELKIPKDVTSYYARYAWANIARSLGYSKDIISQALGHEYGHSMTSIYLDAFDNSVIDEANDKVIEAVIK
jgi:integrase